MAEKTLHSSYPDHRQATHRARAVPLIATTVVGSYPQPEWLVDRSLLGAQSPPRVRATDIWRVPPLYLEEAQDDATAAAVLEMERAGIDIVTDGEIRRESYSNYFAAALDGIDVDNPGVALNRSGQQIRVPRVVGPVRRRRPVHLRDLQVLRSVATGMVKITVPGPFTMTQQVQNDYYPELAALAIDLAAAINEEIRDLKAAGADVVQIDEPYLQARPEAAGEFAIAAIDRALNGVDGPIALHTCFGYAHTVHQRPVSYPFLAELNSCAAHQISIESAQQNVDMSILRQLPDKMVIVGVLNLADDAPVESAAEVADRIRRALRFIEPERLMVAPDCGMKYLPRRVAEAKLRALVAGAAIVRSEL